jgi:hypothetical protein
VTYMRVPSRGPYVRVFDVSVQLRSRPSGRGGGARAVALCRSRVPSLLSDTGHTASTQVHTGRLTMLSNPVSAVTRVPWSTWSTWSTWSVSPSLETRPRGDPTV